MTEFVVPRSMPTALAMVGSSSFAYERQLVVEARRLAERFQFEKLDELMHATLAVMDALAELGEERRGVDRSFAERGDRGFDRGPARDIEAVQQLPDATAGPAE